MWDHASTARLDRADLEGKAWRSEVAGQKRVHLFRQVGRLPVYANTVKVCKRIVPSRTSSVSVAIAMKGLASHTR